MAKLKIGLIYVFSLAVMIGGLLWLPREREPRLCNSGTVAAMFTSCKVITPSF